MRAENYFSANKDLTFYYEQVIDWERLVPLFADAEDAAPMVQYAFYSSPAAMIMRFGSDALKERWVSRLARGEIIGWVAMTEPEAGSDVGNLSTTATRQADGTWRIDGRKQFISSGNGEVGVLLARAIPGSRGLDGLALFVVPRCVPDPDLGERQNFAVERAEE